MKKILVALLFSASAFSENLILENQTPYPKEAQSKIAVQWASSAKEVDDHNKAILYGTQLNPSTLHFLSQSGTISLLIPSHATYFRIVVWSPHATDPSLLTNWVDIVPNKTYKIDADHLVPAVLMPGSGC